MTTFIDLFAGIGGFHYALEEQGLNPIWASEWDTKAAELYALNHGLIPAGDITQIAVEDIPPHDVLTAGFPCQAFSISGKQAGFADARGTLFFDIARIVAHHHPKVVFLENVRNFAKHDEGRTLATVKKTLEDLGYDFYGKLFNASDFGLPQNRQRYIMVAIRSDLNATFNFPTPPNFDVALEDILETGDMSKYEIHREDVIFDPNKFLTARQNASQQIGKVAQGRQGERIYDPKGHAITLSAYGGGIGAKTGLYLIDGKVRKLSPRECARLQGFPESFILPESPQTAWKVFGNSVPINLLRAITQSIKESGVFE